MSNDSNHKGGGGRKSFAKPGRPAPKKPLPPQKPAEAGERIAKVIARAGLCSRRDAEIWIEQGRVSVNGAVLTSAALNVTPADRIDVDGKPLAARERTRLFMFHKPRGLVATDKDPEGRATIFDFLGERFPNLPRLISVGRLDINTEGLLLLTNDGGLARVLELPATGWLRRYRVRANGATDQTKLDELARGVTVEGVEYAGIEARLDRVQGANVWISLGLREGKNREVKRVLEHIGLAVNRLIRLSFGPFQLGELPEGAIEEVRTRVIADQLGEALAAQAGVDFNAPIFDRAPEPTPKPAEARWKRSEPSERGGDPRREPRADERDARPHKGKRETRDKFAPREQPTPRKHVSALRAERAEAAKGERKRTERGTTEDRRGRAVAVERVVTATKKLGPATSRNARRFAAERFARDEDGDDIVRAPRKGAPPRSDQRRQRVEREKPQGETGRTKFFKPRGEPTGESRFERRVDARRQEARPDSRPEPRQDKPAGRKFDEKRSDKPFRSRDGAPTRGRDGGFAGKPGGEPRKPGGDRPRGKPFGKPHGKPQGKPRGKPHGSG